MKPYKKAYKVDLSRVQEGYLYSEDIIYAKTRGKAKSLVCLSEYSLLNGEDMTFLNIPIIRSKNDDIFLVDGVEKSLSSIEYDKRKKEKEVELEKLLAENPKGKAYIKKGGLYWRPNNSGYTEFQRFAGVYDLKDAVSTCKSSDLGRYERPILIDKKEHNEMITKTIKDLETRLIC